MVLKLPSFIPQIFYKAIKIMNATTFRTAITNSFEKNAACSGLNNGVKEI